MAHRVDIEALRRHTENVDAQARLSELASHQRAGNVEMVAIYLHDLWRDASDAGHREFAAALRDAYRQRFGGDIGSERAARRLGWRVADPI